MPDTRGASKNLHNHCTGRAPITADRLRLFGAGDGIRTRDPNLGKVVLYP
jgi:hypothetical protein